MTTALVVDCCEAAEGDGDRPGMLNEAERTWCEWRDDEAEDEEEDEEGVASAGDGDGVHIVLAVLITTPDLPALTGTAGVAVGVDEDEVGGTGEEDGLTRWVAGDGETDEREGSVSGDGEAGSAWWEKVDDWEAVD